MNVVIKNNSDAPQRAIIFGSMDSCMEVPSDHQTGNYVSFFDFKTDDGIDISMDGASSPVARKKMICEKIFDFSHCEYRSSQKHIDVFLRCRRDANGQMLFDHIQPAIFMNPKASKYFPIKIQRLDLFKIDYYTSFLFILRPNEKIELDFK